jgi:hypothetical protein
VKGVEKCAFDFNYLSLLFFSLDQSSEEFVNFVDIFKEQI